MEGTKNLGQSKKPRTTVVMYTSEKVITLARFVYGLELSHQEAHMIEKCLSNNGLESNDDNIIWAIGQVLDDIIRIEGQKLDFSVTEKDLYAIRFVLADTVNERKYIKRSGITELLGKHISENSRADYNVKENEILDSNDDQFYPEYETRDDSVESNSIRSKVKGVVRSMGSFAREHGRGIVIATTIIGLMVAGRINHDNNMELIVEELKKEYASKGVEFVIDEEGVASVSYDSDAYNKLTSRQKMIIQNTVNVFNGVGETELDFDRINSYHLDIMFLFGKENVEAYAHDKFGVSAEMD